MGGDVFVNVTSHGCLVWIDKSKNKSIFNPMSSGVFSTMMIDSIVTSDAVNLTI